MHKCRFGAWQIPRVKVFFYNVNLAFPSCRYEVSWPINLCLVKATVLRNQKEPLIDVLLHRNRLQVLLRVTFTPSVDCPLLGNYHKINVRKGPISDLLPSAVRTVKYFLGMRLVGCHAGVLLV